MPRVLTQSEVDDFRERLCAAAERLFAEHGPEAVTMRQLAAELGVSPMTPYRYFEDKDHILASIRAKCFSRLAAVLEAARDSATGGRARGAAVGEAYVTFALQNPGAYKLMFDLNQPDADRYPDLVAASARCRDCMTAYIRDQIAEGMLSGDPDEVGQMFWAAAHGAVVLELAGRLPPGSARGLNRAMGRAMFKGLQPGK